LGKVLESRIPDEEPTKNGKEGLGNDKVKRLSEKVGIGDVAVKDRVEVRVNPCEKVLVIVVMAVDWLDVVGIEAGGLGVLNKNQLDVYSTPVLTTMVDCTGAVGGSMEEAAGSPGVGVAEAGRLDVLGKLQLDVYGTPVLILVDRTGGRLGRALLFNHWVVPSITE
jgi:hypothetical protein